ncbi:MAG: Rossmann-like fold-containing protein, partial [Candidatus Aenigmatarchaeota archaeon]
MLEYRGFQVKVPAGVYEPREDTDLLAEAAEKIKGKDVLEMGCGCGVISLILAKNGNTVTAVDIDQKAVDATIENAMNNRLKLKVIKSDLFRNVKGRFDYILFNFPYLPEAITDENRAWAVGEDIELVRAFAAAAHKHLRPGGKILFVISSLTNLEKVIKAFHWNGYKTRILQEKKIPWE